eukprot:gene19665-21612_t
MFIGCGSYCIIQRTQVMQYDCREMDTYFCSPVVLWDSCFNYVRKSKRPVMCPDHLKILEPTGQWMNSSSNSRTPRAVWSTEGLHLLVAKEYICPGTVFGESHRIRTTDSMLIDIIVGIMYVNLEIAINERVKELQQLLNGCMPDSETIRRMFVCWCNIYRKEMGLCMERTKPTALMADHLFKVSANIGVHQEADSKWLRLFNSLFIVMKENKEVLSQMLHLFAATGHINYAKSARLYLQEMQKLPETHPWLHAQFTDGHHTVQRTNKNWTGIWTDLAIEQTLMRSIKSRGRLTGGRGMTESLTGAAAKSSEQHEEIGKSRTKQDYQDCLKFLNWLNSRNPFLVPDENLHSLSSGIMSIRGSDDVNCERAEDVGKLIQATLDNIAYNKASIKRKDQVKTLESLQQKSTPSKSGKQSLTQTQCSTE